MLFRNLKTHLILSPTTDVGKTIFSTLLCRASIEAGERVSWVKPVGTGGDGEGDEGHLRRYARRGGESGLELRTLFEFEDPVSPHLAVRLQREREREREKGSTSSSKVAVPTDDELREAISKYAQEQNGALQGSSYKKGTLFIESAGGVHSPTLTGTSQIDLLRPLLPPIILIASSQLGGISTTISAYESLVMRGYEVDGVLIFGDRRGEGYRNWEYLGDWFRERREMDVRRRLGVGERGKKGIPLAVVPHPPPFAQSPDEEITQMTSYYDRTLDPTLDLTPNGNLTVPQLLTHLRSRHEERLEDLSSSARRTLDTVWWPFVQHASVKREEDVMVIDSAARDFFSTFNPDSRPESDSSGPATKSLLRPLYDSSCSWWTQSLGHSNSLLTLSASHASGRYGHVLFPTATHAPALRLAERLLESDVGKGWAAKVFFSDNGSTGVEVALKMGLRSWRKRYMAASTESGRELGVIGLKGSYHGDTIGSMDACEPSVYSESVEWYRGRGFWFDPPVVEYVKGEARVKLEGGQWDESRQLFRRILDGADGEGEPSLVGVEQRFGSGLEDVYDIGKRIQTGDPLIPFYRSHILRILHSLPSTHPHLDFSSLIIEPVLMGAGGMLFVDPLFQRVLVETVRDCETLFSGGRARQGPEKAGEWKGLPVIFDEVFVGLYRLGKVTGASFLSPTSSSTTSRSCLPDVSIHAKILTGGLLPLAVTLASQPIYESFLGEKKEEALLHGHSYTANPIGCAVAGRTLEGLERLAGDGVGGKEPGSEEWQAAKGDWGQRKDEGEATSGDGAVWSFWSKEFVEKVSWLEGRVESVVALGTVLAVRLRDVDGGGGYQSLASSGLLETLRLKHGIHARPLGNVVYFMCSLNTEGKVLRTVEERIQAALESGGR